MEIKEEKIHGIGDTGTQGARVTAKAIGHASRVSGEAVGAVSEKDDEVLGTVFLSFIE